MALFLVLRERMLAGYSQASEDSRVRGDNDFFLWLCLLGVLRLRLCLPLCYETVSFLPSAALDEVDGEADNPSDAH